MGRMMGGRMMLRMRFMFVFIIFVQVAGNHFAPIIRNSAIFPFPKCSTGLHKVLFKIFPISCLSPCLRKSLMMVEILVPQHLPIKFCLQTPRSLKLIKSKQEEQRKDPKLEEGRIGLEDGVSLSPPSTTARRH